MNARDRGTNVCHGTLLCCHISVPWRTCGFGSFRFGTKQRTFSDGERESARDRIADLRLFGLYRDGLNGKRHWILGCGFMPDRFE